MTKLNLIFEFVSSFFHSNKNLKFGNIFQHSELKYRISYLLLFFVVVVDVAAAVVFARALVFCSGGGFLQWWFLRWWFLRCGFL